MIALLDYQRIATITGLVFDLLGFSLLFYPDWRVKKADELFVKIPRFFVEKINAKFEEREPVVSAEETMYDDFVGGGYAMSTLCLTRVAGVMVLLGFVLQIIALFI